VLLRHDVRYADFVDVFHTFLEITFLLFLHSLFCILFGEGGDITFVEEEEKRTTRRNTSGTIPLSCIFGDICSCTTIHCSFHDSCLFPSIVPHFYRTVPLLHFFCVRVRVSSSCSLPFPFSPFPGRHFSRYFYSLGICLPSFSSRDIPLLTFPLADVLYQHFLHLVLPFAATIPLKSISHHYFA